MVDSLRDPQRCGRVAAGVHDRVDGVGLLWNRLEPGIQWLLAMGLVMYWSIAATSKAYKRIVTSRAAARAGTRISPRPSIGIRKYPV